MSAPESPDMRSRLARVRGLGAARHGAGTWWLERLTSVALVPLSLWFLAGLFTHILGHTREEIAAWIGQPLVAVPFVLLLLMLFWHSKLGVRVIIEDYVHNEPAKLALLFLSDALHIAAGLLAVLAILRLHLVGIPA